MTSYPSLYAKRNEEPRQNQAVFLPNMAKNTSDFKISVRFE